MPSPTHNLQRENTTMIALLIIAIALFGYLYYVIVSPKKF